MAAVHHITDGKTNWTFLPEGDSVTLTITKGYGIYSSDKYSLEEGRKFFKMIKEFNSDVKKGFTKLGKMRKLTTQEQVIKYDEGCREWYGEDNWPEFSLCTWEEFQECGFIVVYG